ncbi:galactose-binding domain-like protein [Aspergillus unguis]
MPASSTTTMLVTCNVRIPMRGGVQLVADIYLPASEGQWPVALFRCPYDRTDPEMGQQRIVDPSWLSRQGFAVVVQDTRGRGESEGTFDPVYQEVDDGYDTVEWAAVQPWSTGAVGIYGSSYMGITSYQAMTGKPPHLRAAIPFVATPASLFERPFGDMFEAEFYGWYALLTARMTIARMDLDPAEKEALLVRTLPGLIKPADVFAELPLSEVDVLSDKALAPDWHHHLTEPNKATAEPSKKLLADTGSVGDVALLHITGYRDFLARSVFELAARLAGHPNHRLIAGPWTHRGPYSGATGARELPETSSPAGPLGWGPLIAAWFDIHLRGGTGAAYPGAARWLQQKDPVVYYIEGENKWASAPRWPPASVQREWRLTSGGDARSSHGNGRLLFPGAMPEKDASDCLTADPNNPFPTWGGALGNPSQGGDGIQDQRQFDHRKDLLVYTSEILSSAVRIAGSQTFSLHLSSTAPDADICVNLVDVEPPGFAYNVSEGFLRTRYRRGGTTDWLRRETAEEINMSLAHTAHVFKPGHRIRIMLAGANYPRFSRNLHTKVVPEFGTMSQAVAAEHTVHHGRSNSSVLVLNEIV